MSRFCILYIFQWTPPFKYTHFEKHPYIVNCKDIKKYVNKKDMSENVFGKLAQVLLFIQFVFVTLEFLQRKALHKYLLLLFVMLFIFWHV